MWNPDIPEDTSHLQPEDYDQFIAYWLNKGQDDPQKVIHALGYFFEGLALSLYPVLVHSYILGQVEAARMMNLPWAHLLELSPSNRRALKHLTSDSLRYIKRANDHIKHELTGKLHEQLLRNINSGDLGVALAQSLSAPIPALGMGVEPYCVMVARTETAKLHTLGRCDKLAAEGKKLAVITPHTGACEHCRRLIEGRVFLIRDLADGIYDNYGKSPREWVGTCPQHPNCRHSPQPLLPHEEAEAMATLRGMGLNLLTFPRDGILLSTGGLIGPAAEEWKENGRLDYAWGSIAPSGKD